jgi:hypothetical protein
MKIRLYEDYYFWCCEWCDTENRVLWARIDEGVSCGACHKKLLLPVTDCSLQNAKLSAALC